MPVSVKEKNVYTIIKEFENGSSRKFDITGIDPLKVKFLWRVVGGPFKDLHPGDYRIDDKVSGVLTLEILNETLWFMAEGFQVVEIEDITSSEYDATWGVDLTHLKDKYNQLAQDVNKLWTYTKRQNLSVDDRLMDNVLPTLDKNEIWVKAEEGYVAIDLNDIFRDQQVTYGMVVATNDYGNFPITSSWKTIQTLFFDLYRRDNLLFICTVPIYTTIEGRVKGKVYVNNKLREIDLEMWISPGNNVFTFSLDVLAVPMTGKQEIYLDLIFIPDRVVQTYECVVYENQARMILFGAFLKSNEGLDEMPVIGSIADMRKKQLKVSGVGASFRQIPKPVLASHQIPQQVKQITPLTDYQITSKVVEGLVFEKTLSPPDFTWVDPSLEVVGGVLQPKTELHATKVPSTSGIAGVGKFVVNNFNFEVSEVILQ